MAALLDEFEGQVDLIYIDPPFATGANFRARVEVGEGGDKAEKAESVIEQKAYNDTWGRGKSSYLQMMYERLALMCRLLKETGSIYVHLDYRMNSHVRLIMDDIFGEGQLLNEIIWQRTASHNDPGRYGVIHDTLLYYSKSNHYVWNNPRTPQSEEYIRNFFVYAESPTGEIMKLKKGEKAPAGWRQFRLGNFASPHPRPNLMYEYKGYKPPTKGWKVSLERMKELDAQGRLYFPPSKERRIATKSYLDEVIGGKPTPDLWLDMKALQSQSAERLGYPTQKPEALLERIILASSNPDDLVADFFCGSGTALAAAEKLGRRWIGSDLGKYAIHTARKRLMEIAASQDLENEGQSYGRPPRPFLIQNLSEYKTYQFAETEEENRARYFQFILDLYRAQAEPGHDFLHGKKGGRYVHIGELDSEMTIDVVRRAVAELKSLQGRALDVLAWEFAMNFDLDVETLQQEEDVTIIPIRIPREALQVRDPKKENIHFYEMPRLDVKAVWQDKQVIVRITDFNIYNLEDFCEDVIPMLKSYSDLIDYWAVDYAYDGERFVSRWQTYRTRQDRGLELQCAVDAAEVGKEIVVKVVDIFGNDTNRRVEIEEQDGF